MKNKLLHGVNPVYVEWIDSMSISGWNDNPSRSDLRCASVGHLIFKDKDRVRISLNKSAYQTGEVIEIPMLAVKKIKKLKV